jgi:hypothetical protein
MTTPDEPSQPLTRRRLRELKLTGQTPVIGPEEIEAARVARDAEEAQRAADTPEPFAAPAADAEPISAEPTAPEPDAPEPDAAEPDAAEPSREEPAPAEEVASLEAAAAESSAPSFPVGSGRPLTRREVREQERLRTNQFAVIPPDGEAPQAVEAAPTEPAPEVEAEPEVQLEPEVQGEPEAEAPSLPITVEPNVAAIETKIVGENETSVVYEVVEVPFEHAPEGPDAAGAEPHQAEAESPVAELVFDEPSAAPEAVAAAARPDAEFAEEPVETVYVPEDARLDTEADERPTVAPAFGSTLLKAPAPATPPAASFEDILAHATDSSGTSTASSALILASDPGAIPLSAPIDATGEILVTSTHALPDGFGSRGHAAGTTDGKEVDVVLIDGELPLASSPTPIAASDAVSTSKSPAEVIRPPAPEKSHRLTLLLGITAGVLGIALIGVVVAAFTTGVLG